MAQTTDASPDKPKLLYLPKDEWSPRYDATFYFVKIEDKKLVTTETAREHLGSFLIEAVPPSVGGNTVLPAYYYEVVVYREHSKKSLLRRYSQFKWLYDQLKAHPPSDEQLPSARPIQMPPGTCLFQRQDDAFAQNRLEQLNEFIDDVLGRPGYASHEATLAFLQLT